MAVIEALRETPGTLVRNPVVFVPIIAILILELPQFALQSNPLLAAGYSLVLTIVFIVVMPFFQGGMIGLADEALDGRTSLGRFVDAGREHYVSLFGAYILLLGVNVVLGFVLLSIVFGGGVLVMASGNGPSGAALGTVAIVVGVVALVYLVVVFLVQFYAQAIVLDDRSAVGGFKRSFAVVRRNLLGVFGYSLFVGITGLLAGAVFGVASIVLSPQSMAAFSIPPISTGATVLVVAIVALVGILYGGFMAIFTVAVYRRLTDAMALTEPV